MRTEKQYQELKDMLSEIIYLDEERVLMDITTDDIFFISLRSYLYRFKHILNLYKHSRTTEQETYNLFAELFYRVVDTVFRYKDLNYVSSNSKDLHLHALVLKCFTRKTKLNSSYNQTYYEDVYKELKENEIIIKNYLA